MNLPLLANMGGLHSIFHRNVSVTTVQVRKIATIFEAVIQGCPRKAERLNMKHDLRNFVKI